MHLFSGTVTTCFGNVPPVLSRLFSPALHMEQQQAAAAVQLLLVSHSRWSPLGMCCRLRGQEPESRLSRTSRAISRLFSSSSSQSKPKQPGGQNTAAAAAERATHKALIQAESSVASSFVVETVSSNDGPTVQWAAAATAEVCVPDVEGDAMARTPSDLNAGSFTRKQQQQQQQSAQQDSQAYSRQREAGRAGRSSSQHPLRHPSSIDNAREGQQRDNPQEGRVHRSNRKKSVNFESQQQQQQQQQQSATGQSLQEKWQAMWNISVEAQALAKATAATAAAVAEQQALLAAAEAEEEEEQPPTGASTAAARRSSYGEAAVELLQLQLQQQPSDPWVHHLAAWAQECPELIELQLQDTIPVPDAYQLPDNCWQDRQALAATAEPAGQPEDAPAASCRNMHGMQAEQTGMASSATAPDGGISLQEDLQQHEEEQGQQQQEKEKEQEKDRNLKPLEKPIDFVAELTQAVAAVKELVKASSDAASCGLSTRVDSTHAVLEEGWRAVQKVDWELDAYEKYAKWVPKRAQNVSLQAVLQQLDVLANEARV